MSAVSSVERRESRARSVFRAVSGNFLEMYDFTVYGYYAAAIAATFFPAGNEFVSLMLAFSVFGAGFLMRPIGAIVLGAYMDRHGRRKGLILSLTLMAIGTMCVAFVPSYHAIGLVAPAIVLFGRLLQGFSAGAELGGVSVYLAEIATKGNRGFYCSWQSASQQVAVVFAASLGVLLNSVVPAQEMTSWGWRVPFVIGTLFVPLGYWLRRGIDEAHRPAASGSGSGDAPAPLPLAAVLRRHRRALFAGLGLTIGGTATHYIIVFYMAIYGVRTLHLPAWIAMLAGCVAGMALMLVSPLGGALADRIGRKPVAGWSRLVLTLAIYPAFVALNRWPGAASLLGAIAVLSVVHALYCGATAPMLGELFPRAVRATGGALVYSLGVAIFGGFAQFIVTWLIAATGDPTAPAWYAIACGMLSFAALASIEERAGKRLD